MTLLAVLLAYLVGSIPTGYLFGLLRGIDVRSLGSGATGGTNVGRALGWPAGVITGVIDAGKGVAAAALGRALDPGGGWLVAACVIAAVAGHSWPVFIAFRGGKGVATAAGGLLWVHPYYTLVAIGVFVLIVLITRYVSLGSVVATILAALLIGLSSGPPSTRVLVLGAAAIILFRHNANIGRLLRGTERRLGRQA